MRAYLAGKMRGVPEFNFPAFLDAARLLRQHGHIIFSPAERDLAEGFDPTLNSLDGFDLQEALSADFRMILDADAVILLPGWEDSSGARAERFVAEMTGRDVYLYLGDGDITDAPEWDGNPTVPKEEKKVDGRLHDYWWPNGEEVKVPDRAIIRGNSACSPQPMVDPYRYGEIRVTDPTTGGEKGQKIAQLGAIDPGALMELAKVAGFGASKYARYNFLKGYDWSLSYDALQRHLHQFWSGEDVDAESGFSHLGHAAWHCLALLAFMQRNAGTDDRPVPSHIRTTNTP